MSVQTAKLFFEQIFVMLLFCKFLYLFTPCINVLAGCFRCDDVRIQCLRHVFCVHHHLRQGDMVYLAFVGLFVSLSVCLASWLAGC